MTITRDEALDRHERLMLELIRKGGFISDVGRVGLLELKAPFPDDDPSWAKNERARALAAARVAIDGGMLLESSAHAMSVEVEAAEAVHAWLQLTPWREEYDFRIMKIYGWDRYRAKAWVEPAASPIAPTATALLAKLLRELRGTPESFSAADERGYVQAAGLADGGLHVEIASDRYLALPLRPREEAAMRQLGFNEPAGGTCPNWWLRVGPDDEPALDVAAQAAATAITHVYGNKEIYVCEALTSELEDLRERLADPERWDDVEDGL